MVFDAWHLPSACLVRTAPLCRRVRDADYRPPFALTAKLNKLTIKVDRPQLSPADIKSLQAGMQEKAKAD